jgi:IS30 family transposase
MLGKGWSPELIAGRLKKEHPQWPTISHEAIYQWIYSERRDLVGYLVRAHPKRRKRWKISSRKIRIPERVSIQKRPAYINQRREPGHWETDLLVGSGRAALQVTIERKSRLSRIEKIPNKTAVESRLALERVLRQVPGRLRESVTYDNGSENIEHQLLNEHIGTRSWFCEPYHSWEKGQVENTNGLIRHFVPKRSKLDDLPGDEIRRIENWLNNRPRKVLQFQTPNEVFNAWCCT